MPYLPRAIAVIVCLVLITSIKIAHAGSVHFYLQGTIAGICELKNHSVPQTVHIDLNEDEITMGMIEYTCTTQGGFTRKIISQNNGAMHGSFGNNKGIAYKISHTGGDVLKSFTSVQLTQPKIDVIPASTEFLGGKRPL